MVGLAVTCSPQGSRLRIAVLEQHVPQSLAVDAPPQLRVSAINAASEKLLIHLGVWSDIVVRRAYCYHNIKVWDKDNFGRITFDDQSMDYSHLSHIVENSEVHCVLWQKAQHSADIAIMAPAEIQQVVRDESEAFLNLKDGAMLTARLVAGADGTNFRLRNKVDIPLTLQGYRHRALVATIRMQEAHGAVVCQVFHGEEILAFLPPSDPHLRSIVWSLSSQETERMQQASINELNQTLNIVSDNRLGLCSLEDKRQVSPLTGCHTYQFAAHRLALVGDAAYTIHPLASQGINLGFMDAAELTDEFKRLQRQGEDTGQYLYLRRYERSRRHSIALVLAGTQGFRELFAGKNPTKKLLYDIGLKLAGTLLDVKP